MTVRVPFNERGGALRGAIDLVSGRFPRFVVGGAVASDLLPVFHFHEVTVAELEPKLRYLAENGYRTVTSDDIDRFVRGTTRLDGRHVALCFDDAWTSLWTVATPLLQRYGLSAIAYAIPARIEDATECRPTIDHETEAAIADDGRPFVTWPELAAMHASGLVDVQGHTNTHSRVFCSTEIAGFVTPEYTATPLLNRPQLAPPPLPRFVSVHDLGAPLYVSRSRMSDARRVNVPVEVHERCTELVRRNGGREFFGRPAWEAQLRRIADGATGAVAENDDEQQQAIEDELDESRCVLNERLKTNGVNHVCLPWGVSGQRTAAVLDRLGYRTAFANRLRGIHAVRRGDDPHWLKRLPNKYIFCLPGRGRRIWT